MKRPHPLFPALLPLALVLGACASGPGGYAARSASALPAGSTVSVNQRLEVGAEQYRVHVQDGRVIRYQNRNRFAVWCGLGLRRGTDGRPPAAIEPGTFRSGPPGTTTHARDWPAGGLQVAGAESIRLLAEFGGGGPYPGFITYVLEIPLRSERQPLVHDLTCKVDRYHATAGPIERAAIAAALGDLVTLEPSG